MLSELWNVVMGSTFSEYYFISISERDVETERQETEVE